MSDNEKDDRPLVVLAVGDAPRAVRRVKTLLIEASDKADCSASDKVFRRGSEIVHLNRNELSAEDGDRRHDAEYHVADDLVIRAANKFWFGDRVERAIHFVRRVKVKDKDGDEVVVLRTVEPSEKLLQRVGHIVTTRDFAALKGTTETPTLRPDYSLLQKPGYDRKSGLFFDPGRTTFPEIPDQPTKDDARKALELFVGERGILHDFPFTDAVGEPKGLSQSVAVAMLLTSVVRRSLPTAPMFGIDAYEAQSGKTLLGTVAGALATGRDIAARPWPTDEYQRSNALMMAFEAGDPVILYDNISSETPLEGESLNIAITKEFMKGRRLGSNSGADEMYVPTNSLMIGTGNHMIISGDMSEGRVLITRIVPDRALWQRKFLYRDLLAHVIGNRPQLVAAALTILRAYAVAKDKRPPTGFRHRQWGDLVAAAVAWLGLPDPCLAEQRSKVTDPVRDEQNSVVRIWAKEFGNEWVDIHKLIAVPSIKATIAGVKGMDPDRLTWKSATPFLHELIGVPRLGFVIEHVAGDNKHRPARWRLNAAHGNEHQWTTFDAAEEFAADPHDDDDAVNAMSGDEDDFR